MTTITIAGLPLIGTVADTAIIPSENLGTTQGFTAASLKTYMTTLPNLTVTGTLAGTISSATPTQSNITAVGTLVGVTTSGQIVSTIVTGTAPLSIQSNTLVANLYVARAATADSAVGGITTSTAFANVAGGDVTISGTYGALSTTLNTVNPNYGLWGGNVGTTYYIPQLTVDTKGRITSAGNVAINLNLATQSVTSLSGTANQITVTGGSVGVLTLSLPSQLNITNLSASNVASTTVYDNNNRVVTGVTATAGSGISISSAVTAGPSASLTINNTGILSVSNGAGLSATTVSGAVTLTNTGVTSIAGTANQITASGSTGGITLSLPNTLNVNAISATGAISTTSTLTVTGAISGGTVNDTGNRVVTGVTATAGSGISITGATTGGPSAGFTVTNNGVLSIAAGNGISITGTGSGPYTGAVTISYSATGNAVGNRTISSGTPSGGSDGDIWYQI